MQSNKINLEDFNLKNKHGQFVKVHQQNIVDHILDNYNFFFLGDSGDYPYMYENGVYTEISVNDFMEIIKHYIHRDLLVHKIKEAVYKLLASEQKPHKKENTLNNYPKTVINFKNCMYDAKTGKTYAHNPKYYSTCQIPFNLDFKHYKKPKNFLKFVSSNCNAEKQQLLLEYMGYSMTKDLSFKKALFIKGVQDSGKSVLINLISAILGEKNVSSVPLQDLSGQFFTIQIKDKLLNISSDINANALKNSGIFKQIIGGDIITCQEKFKAPIRIRPHCKQIYASNNLIDIIGDSSGATTDKFLYLYWDYVPSNEEYDPDLLEKLIPEIPDIICLCMQALKKAYDRKRLTETKESKQVSIEVENTSDNLQAFIFDCCHVDKNKKIRTNIFYDRYKEYCEQEGLTPKYKKTITKDMGSKNFHKIKTGGYLYFTGIGFDDETFRDYPIEEDITEQNNNTSNVLISGSRFKQGKIDLNV